MLKSLFSVRYVTGGFLATVWFTNLPEAADMASVLNETPGTTDIVLTPCDLAWTGATDLERVERGPDAMVTRLPRAAKVQDMVDLHHRAWSEVEKCSGCGQAGDWCACSTNARRQADRATVSEMNRCWNFTGQDCPERVSCHYPLHCYLSNFRLTPG